MKPYKSINDTLHERIWNPTETRNENLNETLNETLKKPQRNPHERLEILIRTP